MKPFSAALGALFDTNAFVSADLYTFLLPGGGTAYLTSADANLTYEGVTYLSGAPRIERSAISQKTGLQVASVKIDVFPTANDTIGGLTWLSALKRGYFDGGSVTISRVFAPAWGQPVTGAILMMAGRIADATFGRSKASIEINSWTEVLSNQMPRTYYQSPCNNTLGDARCGFDLSLCEVGGTITSVDSASVFVVDLALPFNWLAYGRLIMASGGCNTERRPIASNSGPTEYGNQVILQVPLSQAPAVGDTFIAYAGCDKTQNHLSVQVQQPRPVHGLSVYPCARNRDLKNEQCVVYLFSSRSAACSRCRSADLVADALPSSRHGQGCRRRLRTVSTRGLRSLRADQAL